MRAILIVKLRLAVALLLAAVLSAASVRERLFFEGVRKKYRPDETVKFSVVSSAVERVLFSCSVERLEKGEWLEIIASIHNPHSKSARLYPLAPGKRRSLKFDLSTINYPGVSVLSSGSYRFRLDAFDKNAQQQLGSVASSSFEIVGKLRDHR